MCACVCVHMCAYVCVCTKCYLEGEGASCVCMWICTCAMYKMFSAYMHTRTYSCTYIYIHTQVEQDATQIDASSSLARADPHQDSQTQNQAKNDHTSTQPSQTQNQASTQEPGTDAPLVLQDKEAQEGSSSSRKAGVSEVVGLPDKEGGASVGVPDEEEKEGVGGEEKRNDDENEKDMLSSIFSALPGIHQFEGMVSYMSLCVCIRICMKTCMHI